MTEPAFSDHIPPSDDLIRRKRELVLILLIIPVVALLIFAETRMVDFGADFPISYTILMFVIININLLLLLLLIFLVFRNLVKLYYDRKRRVPGSRLRTRLVIAFVTLTMLPTTVLFAFSMNFISTSIAFWFNVPVEHALENSIAVGQHYYAQVSENNRFFLERAAYQIHVRKMMEERNREALANYAQVVQRAFHLDGVDVHAPDGSLLVSAEDPLLADAMVPIAPEHLHKIPENAKTRDVTETILSGELIRTVGSIPFGARNEGVEGYLVITRQIPTEVVRNFEAIIKGSDEYQQVKLLKQPVQQIYYLALTVVALLVVFCAVWFAFYLAKTLTSPIMELAEGTRRIAEGDLQFQIESVGDDEIGTLIASFNKMTRDLAIGQEQLALSARMLRQQNAEIEERRRYMEIILKNVSAGVISVNSAGIVTTMNTSAERMLGIEADTILKSHYRNAVPEAYLPLARDFESRIQSAGGEMEMPLSLSVEGQPRNFLSHFSALMDEAGNRIGTVMVFDDVTELEKAQRMAAWREVARRIAHEVKNPLTPLSLSAQRLRRKYKEMLAEPVFDECTRVIIEHVELIRNLVNEFSTYARFPAANPRPFPLAEIVRDSATLFREGHESIDFVIAIADDLPKLLLDPQQTRQLVLNLLDNAVAAVSETETQGKISIRLSRLEKEDLVRLEICDNGKGILPEEKVRLFEPYFSTKSTGTGLGLAIVNSIVAEHHAEIRVRDNPPSGACFTVDYPIPAV